jgi:hypothetical protein
MPKKRTTYKEQYDHFLPLALKLPEADIQPCRADVPVALANIKLGIKAVLGTKEQIAAVKEHLPKIHVQDLLDLPDIGRALLFSLGKVVTRTVSAGEIDAAIKEISGPREQLLDQAEIFAKRGLLDKALVAKIRAGSGKYDMAKDGLDLVALFTDNAVALKGQHPFTKAELDKLRKTSEWLLESLTPGGARTEAKKKSSAEEARDRLWTLLVQRHPDLRKISYYFHGEEFEGFTPRLQSRVAQAVLDEEPAPAVPPAEGKGGG